MVNTTSKELQEMLTYYISTGNSSNLKKLSRHYKMSFVRKIIQKLT
jgi:hypothetical protein